VTRLHLAPGTPWGWLLAATLAVAVLGMWAYRFAAPPLPALARRVLTLLRFAALALLLWLLAQPALDLPGAGRAHLVVLLDRSRSMALPVRAGGETRAVAAARAVESLERSLRGRASLEVIPFAEHLTSSAAGDSGAGATALGTALGELGGSEALRRASAALVVSDGAVNAGGDPVAAAQALGLPVHTVQIGEFAGVDRAVTSIETPTESRVGRAEPVRVHLTSDEPAGVPMPVHLTSEGREIAHGVALSPGPGAEAVCELTAVPLEGGLAIWTARVDSLAHEPTILNNARSAAIQVAAGHLGVVIVSAGLNWDLTFLRRSLASDSGLAVTTWTREGAAWRSSGPDGRPLAGARPTAQDLKSCAVLALDAIAPPDVSPEFDHAVGGFVRGGGGLLVLGGPGAGLMRLRAGDLGPDLAVRMVGIGAPRSATPEPTEASAELTAWDDDPARGREAWRAAAPLTDLMPIEAGPGDRVLIASSGGGPPLMLERHVGRGQALLVNGTGVWRWSLSPTDDLAGERGQRLWRQLVRGLAEPVQGEPLRVRPERWLAAAGEPVRLFASLQDSAFRPLAGAKLEGEAVREGGGSRALEFEPREAGTYIATLGDLAPGRYRALVRARVASGAAREARATTEFAVDRWSLEDARAEADSATLAAVAHASGGLALTAAQLGNLPRGIAATLAQGPLVTARLWESPWVLALVVAALSLEWAWRRRRGLP